MPEKNNESINDKELYGELFEEGNPKQKLALSANATFRDARAVLGARGGESGS